MPSLIDKSGNIAYIGQLSLANFVDWLITFCLGAIITLLALLLGGVRPDTHVLLLPLFACLVVLHGLWLAVEKEQPKRLSSVPVIFLPLVVWVWVNVTWVSPTAWRGWYELIYALEAVIFLWVLVNNVRTRAHLWALITIVISPAAYAIFIGFYQFFQNPAKLANAYAEYGLSLSPEFLGQATGSFADPNSFAAFLLILLPSFLIAGLVPRLPMILRVMCLYIGVMFVISIFLTQLFWPLVILLIVLLILPWVCFLRPSRRVWGSLLSVSLFAIAVFLQAVFLPQFNTRAVQAMAGEGEGVRPVLWQEALNVTLDAPIIGAGGGSFSAEFEHSERQSLAKLPMTPHNDYLLILSEYGMLGGLLLLLPSLLVIWCAIRHWRAEPDRVKLKDAKGAIMPPAKFFLLIGLTGVMTFALCLFSSFVFYTPVLTLYGVLFFSILVKSSFRRRLCIPHSGWMRLGYFCLGIILALGFYSISASRIEAQALELHARQRLDQIVEQGVHVSGNTDLLDEVIELYEAAILLDPDNVDAWIGLSAATCQQFYQNPGSYRATGARATNYAQRALELSETYWMGWAQLGIAQGLGGNDAAAEVALARALELAPNNCNAHYYWAAYVSHFKERHSEAIESVQRALEINPNHAAASKLQQKLRIL
ncbi:MAG: O-antigen ligase family protein [Opitutae bacterium]|nr:O-antigen ligase family protein [Opitutae bacterium]